MNKLLWQPVGAVSPRGGGISVGDRTYQCPSKIVVPYEEYQSQKMEISKKSYNPAKPPVDYSDYNTYSQNTYGSHLKTYEEFENINHNKKININKKHKSSSKTNKSTNKKKKK